MRKSDSRDIVLVVDDSPETLRLLTDALEEAGMTVLVAREGEHALSIVEKSCPTSFSWTRSCREPTASRPAESSSRIPALAHVPIIFMTGLTETEHIIKGLEAGGVDYITKPIVPREVLARIRVHLANARMAHSARTALDAFGRFLLAASRTGRVLWYTPQAAKLLSLAFADFDREDYVLPAEIQAWLHQCAGTPAGPEAASMNLKDRTLPNGMHRIYIGQIGPDEYLLRLVEGGLDDDRTVLKQKLAVTEREAEVLLWLSPAASRIADIAEILDLQPAHREQAS